MEYSPHDYQIYATEYITSHPVCAVLLSMGLGKTAITLTAVKDLLFDFFEVRKVLVIAPLRVAKYTWRDEIKKWDHLKDLTFEVAVGTEKQRLKALRSPADIYVINRENVPWLVEKSGLQFDYDMVVVDELSSFKNHTSKRFRSLLKVRPKVKRIVGLTGTPTGSGGLEELWGEYKILDMGERLGRFIGHYRANYFKPDKMNGPVVYTYKPLPGAEKMIYEKISDITISMKSTDHLKMPELVETDYPVEMSEAEMKRYEKMKSDLVLALPDGDITAANAATLSGKLCQMANGIVYGDQGELLQIHNQKIGALQDIIEAANGAPVLVAYWYRHDLSRITAMLSQMGIPWAKLDTDESIQRWNKGDLPVGLIHPASAGHGLNLQAGGHTLVYFSTPWSLELTQQTSGRLYRQGQKSGTVVIRHIVTKGTIDEQIIKALQTKDLTQSRLIDAVRAVI